MKSDEIVSDGVDTDLHSGMFCPAASVALPRGRASRGRPRPCAADPPGANFQ